MTRFVLARIAWIWLLLPLAACTTVPQENQSTPTVSPSIIVQAPVTASATPTRPIATSTTFLTPLVTPTPVLTSAVTSKWIEYWDRRYSYGLAIPCHWTVYPTPLEGISPALTMMSYDENFARANTDKGEWKGAQWPAGALKIDLTVLEGIAPGDSLADVVRQNFDNEHSAVESVQEQALGSHIVVFAVLVDKDLSDKYQVIVFRISPDKVLITSVLPTNAWESSDVKGVLNSVAFSRQEKIVMPSTPPATLLAPVPNWCVGK